MKEIYFFFDYFIDFFHQNIIFKYHLIQTTPKFFQLLGTHFFNTSNFPNFITNINHIAFMTTTFWLFIL